VRWLKNGSFGFAKRWLVCREKPNVPFVRLENSFFCAVGKKLKQRRVGFECRHTRCQIVLVYVGRYVVGSFSTLAGNGLGYA